MKRVDKNRNSELTDFLKYKRGKMTGKERNAFERKLQKDPFAEEAAEGFSDVTSEQAAEDLSRLEKQLNSRVAGRQKIVYYRIAASVAVLALLSSVFILLEKSKPALKTSQSSGSHLSVEKPKPMEPSTHEAMVSEEKMALQKTKLIRKDEISHDKGIRGIGPQTENPKSEKEPELIAKADKYETGAVVAEKRTLAPAACNPASQKYNFKGKIISSEDNMPITGASVSVKGTRKGVVTDTGGNFNIIVSDSTSRTLVADFIGMQSKEFEGQNDSSIQIKLNPSETNLSEVVVMGYGAAKNNKAAREEPSNEDENETGYAPPQPVNGKQDFNNYIEQNIHIPASMKEGTRAVVILSFIVRSTGAIDSIKIIRSPGNEFSDEAARLVRNGPGWKPAESNGRKRDDLVRLRITFK
ncbi:MAG: TonB family protein [Bacteroidales bacterium]|jgi:TonB family protein